MLIFPLSPKIHIPPIYKTTFTPIPELSKISTHYSSNLSPKSHLKSLWASLVAQRVESLPAVRVGDPGWIPGKGRTPGEGNGNPLQYSCLKKSQAKKSHQFKLNISSKLGMGEVLGILWQNPSPLVSLWNSGTSYSLPKYSSVTGIRW